MAAASELHHHLLVRLPGGSLYRGDRLPQRHRHRRSGRHPHPCGCGWHRHHRQRDRLLGRRVRVLHQSAPQRHLRNSVCPLFLHLCGGRPGGQTGRGDWLCGHHRELYRKPSPLRGVAKRAAHRRSQLLQSQRVKGSSSLNQAAAPHFFLSKLYPTSRMHRR